MRKDTEIYCNGCGRKIEYRGEILQEDVLHMEKSWGYFSEKDGERHSLDLCEECYDKWIEKLSIPVTKEEETELI